MSEYDDRLRKEAAFQNSRTVGETERYEARRDKFYYLVDSARADYTDVVSRFSKGRDVVVVGCAEGGVTSLVRLGAGRVLGVDIADEAIAKLNQSIDKEGLSDKASAIVCDAESLDLSDNSYDVICCSGVLHHLDIERAMVSWSRVLRSDGRVVMMEPFALNPLIYLYRLVTPGMRSDDEHPLLPRDIKLLKKHFTRVEVTGYVLTSLFSMVFSYIPGLSSARDRVCSILERFDRVILRVMPGLQYFCWTSVIVLEEPKVIK